MRGHALGSLSATISRLVPSTIAGSAQLSQDLCSTSYSHQQYRGMATKKAGGTARQNPDSASRNLGTKFTHNEVIFPGQIIVRQRGTKWLPGTGVGLGRDHTIFAKTVGRVNYSKEAVRSASGQMKERTVVSVQPITQDPAMQASMVAERARIKRDMLRSRAHEAALFFPMAAAQPAFIGVPMPVPAAAAGSKAAKKPVAKQAAPAS